MAIEAEAVGCELWEVVGRQRCNAHVIGDRLPGWQTPGDMAKQVPLGQGHRSSVWRDRSQGQSEEGTRDRGVDLLVRLHLAIAEVEERLPADEAPRRSRAAGKIVRVDEGCERR